MGKKSKKTVSSTKKTVKTPEQIEQELQEKQDKKLLKKLFIKAKKKAAKTRKAIETAMEPKKREPKNVPAPVQEMKKEHNLDPLKEVKHEVKHEPAKHEVQKHETHKQEFHKKDQGSPKREKIRKLTLTEAQKQKLKAGLLILIGLFMLGFVSYFLYTRLFRAQSIANFLPADNTVGFLEINIDGDSDQAKKFNKLFEKYPVYHPNNLAQLANLVFPLNYETDLKPWLGRKIGIALLKQDSNDAGIKLVLFVEHKSFDKTMTFLKGRALANAGDELIAEQYQGYTVYHYKLSQSYSFVFINNFLVLAGNDALAKQLVDAQVATGNKLQEDPTFQKVNNNLPPSGLMFGYAHMQKLFDTMLKNPAFQSQKTKDLLALQPFMRIFAAEGFTLVANDNNLTAQVFEAIDRSQLQGETYLTYNEKYEGKLLELAGEGSIIFAGGHDLNKELNRIGEIFSVGTDIDTTLYEGILEAQKEKYFGKDIALQSDIYPLLKNEYLLTVENNFEEPVVSVFMNLTDKNDDLARIEKLANAFMKKRAIFSPQIQTVTLPDGTTGQEIVASAEEITRTDGLYNNVNVSTLQLGNLPWSINFAILDNTLVITSNTTALHTIVDRKNGKVPTNLRVSDSFTRTVLPVMRTADEVFHIKLGALIPVLGLDQNEMVKPYVEGFNSLTMAKNFFDDGISTLYVIDVL